MFPATAASERATHILTAYDFRDTHRHPTLDLAFRVTVANLPQQGDQRAIAGVSGGNRIFAVLGVVDRRP